MKDSVIVKNFLNKKNIFAVVGASRNKDKYGYKVYIDLRNSGYNVYPVNPNTEEVIGDKCYPSLDSLPEKPDVVSFVVPPKTTEKVLVDCKKLGIKKVWLQPGSESKNAINFCRQNNIEILNNLCIMIESK